MRWCLLERVGLHHMKVEGFLTYFGPRFMRIIVCTRLVISTTYEKGLQNDVEFIEKR